MRIITVAITALFLSGCWTYSVKLVDNIDESTVRKVKVPEKFRLSGFVNEEDLTVYCLGRQLVFVRFEANTPKEVWCDKADQTKYSGQQ